MMACHNPSSPHTQASRVLRMNCWAKERFLEVNFEEYVRPSSHVGFHDLLCCCYVVEGRSSLEEG